jgi:hypothetical protein
MLHKTDTQQNQTLNRLMLFLSAYFPLHLETLVPFGILAHLTLVIL